MTGCFEIRDLIGAHLLGGLEADEAEALLEHLRVCPSCERSYQRLAPLIALIDLAGPPDVPAVAPPDLEQRIVARLGAEEARAPRLPHLRSRRRRWVAPGLAGALAGAAATVAVVAALGVFGGSAGEQRSRTLTVELQGTRYAPDARATARLRRQLNATTIALEGTNLPPSRPGEHYEVWLNGRDGAFNAGTFRVGADGWAKTILASAAPLDAKSTIDVSIEPDQATQSRPPTIALRATLPA